MDEAGDSGIEMEESPQRGPSRHPSLESQRPRRPSPWVLRWLMGESSLVSQTSGLVEDAIKAGAKVYRSDARSFIRDFDRMSHRPKSRVQEIFDVFIRLGHIDTGSERTTGTLYRHVCPPLATNHC